MKGYLNLKTLYVRKLTPISGGGGEASNLDSVEYALSYHQLGYGNQNITYDPVDGYYIIIEFHKDKAQTFTTIAGDKRGEGLETLSIFAINGIDTYYYPSVRTMGNRVFNYFIIDNCNEWFKNNSGEIMKINFFEPSMIDNYQNYEIKELGYVNGEVTDNGEPGIINIDQENKTFKIGIYLNKDSLWGNDNTTDILDGVSSAESTVRFYKIFREINE